MTAGERRKKVRTTLTIDPVLWERCQAFATKYPVSWSQVAELAFAMYLDGMEAIVKRVEQLGPNTPPDVVQAVLLAEFHQQNHALIQGMYQDISEETKPKPKRRGT